MKSDLSIQEASQLTGLSKYTLRYYEEEGILPAVSRSASQHRRYTERDIRRIEFVKKLRSTGMPIADVKRYVALLQQDNADDSDRLAIMESHQQRLEEQISELSQFLERIKHKVERYRERVTGEKQQH